MGSVCATCVTSDVAIGNVSRYPTHNPGCPPPRCAHSASGAPAIQQTFAVVPRARPGFTPMDVNTGYTVGYADRRDSYYYPDPLHPPRATQPAQVLAGPDVQRQRRLDSTLAPGIVTQPVRHDATLGGTTIVVMQQQQQQTSHRPDPDDGKDVKHDVKREHGGGRPPISPWRSRHRTTAAGVAGF